MNVKARVWRIRRRKLFSKPPQGPGSGKGGGPRYQIPTKHIWSKEERVAAGMGAASNIVLRGDVREPCLSATVVKNHDLV